MEAGLREGLLRDFGETVLVVLFRIEIGLRVRSTYGTFEPETVASAGSTYVGCVGVRSAPAFQFAPQFHGSLISVSRAHSRSMCRRVEKHRNFKEAHDVANS